MQYVYLQRTKSIAATSASVLKSGRMGATKRAMILRPSDKSNEYIRAKDSSFSGRSSTRIGSPQASKDTRNTSQTMRERASRSGCAPFQSFPQPDGSGLNVGVFMFVDDSRAFGCWGRRSGLQWEEFRYQSIREKMKVAQW